MTTSAAFAARPPIKLALPQLTAALLLAPTLCYAHARLDSSSPAAGSEMAVPPAEVVLHFTESIEPKFSRIAVTDKAGAHIEDGAAHARPNDPTGLLVSLKEPGAGTYMVVWNVAALDGHRTHGQFTFRIDP